MAWKILLPQEIMSEGRKLLEDAGHTIIEGRGFETEDVLADMKEHQPDAMIVRITPITRGHRGKSQLKGYCPSRRRVRRS